jgi:hypothetical protein
MHGHMNLKLGSIKFHKRFTDAVIVLSSLKDPIK